jgi:hypothetical protein
VVLASHQQQLQGLEMGRFCLGVCEGRSRHGVRGEGCRQGRDGLQVRSEQLRRAAAPPRSWLGIATPYGF